MKRLRNWCLVFFGWLFVFYNIERLHAPINLASFIYVLAAGVALPLIAIRWFERVRLGWLLAACLASVVGLKWLLGYHIAGTYLPLTLTELGSVACTLLLARQIGRSFEEFRLSAAECVAAGRADRSRPFATGQGELYREVRRARCYHRPLALVSLSVDPESMAASLDRFTRELENDLTAAYVRARLVELLSQEMKASDILTQRDGHFVALLPETNGKAAARMATRLAEAAQERLGLKLRIGVSLFPSEETTFVKLLETAEHRMLAPVEETKQGDVAEQADNTDGALVAELALGNGHARNGALVSGGDAQ
jgi:hypothetical protein